MAARHAAYRDGVVLPFHARHVAPFDRQIVLFDVIGALGRGPAALADARGALLAALEAFRYRRVPLLDRMRARLDRVLVAATKIDHVTTGQYLNARALIEEIFVGTDWAAPMARRWRPSRPTPRTPQRPQCWRAIQRGTACCVPHA
jgi:predicted YcjX-like family ATPase